MIRTTSILIALGVLAGWPTGWAQAQNGLSDGRVSLPDGPGSIGGVGENVDVDENMGSASFRVPFRAPPGANAALTPQMALQYASGRGMGNAGIGWELATPSIERTTDRGLPEYTTGDRFAADGGNELVYVGDLEGSRVYRTRYESTFVRYRWFNAGASGYWTAEYPDGRVGYFGADASGTLVPSARVQADTGETFRYHLVEMVDTSGRRMVQRFVKDGGWVLLDEIQYAFGGQDTPRFSMRFAYEDRPDGLSDASPGYEIRLTRRLSEVRVLSDEATVRRYALAYEMDEASGGLSRLRTVTEFGRDGGRLPIEHTFGYSRTLMGACDVGCERPMVIDAGTPADAGSIATGRSQLVDINGDAVPDLVASSAGGEHTFYLGSIGADGTPSFGAGVASVATVGGSSLVLGDNGVQLFDVNGDGFVDVVNQRSGEVLCNDGSGDWTDADCLMNATSLPALDDDADSDVDPEGMRFFDFDNDKRTDLLVTASDSAAQVFRNTGTSYVAVNIDPLGDTFDAASNLELADMNGDGLLDPVRVIASGDGAILQSRVNLGFGRWTEFRDVSLPDLPSALVDSAELEDLNGDGLDDVVVVAGTSVRYWLNRNGGRFDGVAEIASADVDGEIPERTASETVLFADMNANGTEDVVYVNASGNVRFLELFPVRPNLLARVDNGIGFVRVLSYGTAAAERARDEGTELSWETTMPNAMTVVTETDSFVTLTGNDDGSGVHERTRFQYHSGYYDGEEKDFRGFEQVERRLVSDAAMDGQTPGRTVLEFDVGRDDTYRNGLLVRQLDFGGADGTVALSETRTTYEDCPLDGVEGAVPPVRFICDREVLVINMEGAAPSEWQTVRTEKDYDGFGNLVEQRDLGVTHMASPESPMGCAPCDAPAGTFSGACGPTCEGDEQTFTTSFIEPGAATNHRWLLRLRQNETQTGTDGTTTRSEFYYDGPDFVGLDAGSADRGLLSRQMVSVSDSLMKPELRQAYDAMGNVVAVLDPNGDPADPERHRRDFTYDERGLRVTRVTVQAGAYDLVQDVSYESSFLLASEATDFRVVMDGSDRTPRNPSRFRYDEFGRVVSVIRPGDDDGMPTEEFRYELGDPVTRIVVRARRTVGGPLDTESIVCRDGLDRVVQTRTRLASGRYQVDGFVVRNRRGEVVRSYQPYVSGSGECEMAPPAGVRFTATTYDSLGRVVEVAAPDEAIYGSASVSRTQYLPLGTVALDANDVDSSSPHAGTPVTTLTDGLGRTIRIERSLSPSETASYRVYYDGLGRVARVEDPSGSSKTQRYDRIGRATEIVDPNGGTTTLRYDAAGNVIGRTDARGVTHTTEYDALNRAVLRYDAADMMGTSEQTQYDFDGDCNACRNGAGRIVGQTYRVPDQDAPGVDAFGYDTRGRRVFFRRNIEGRDYETTYAFDAAGSLTEANFPDGRRLSYTYDDAQRPLSATVDGQAVVRSATYDERGRLEEFEYGNGVLAGFEYDDLMRVSRASFRNANDAFFDISVTRDRAGNVLAQSDAVTTAAHPTHAATYVYDAFYRVTQAEIGGGETIRAAYDLSDNLLSRTSSLGDGSVANAGAYTYGERPNAATNVGGVSYGYDAAGNVTSRDALQLIWDHRGRLAQATNGDELTSSFGYAPSGERVFAGERGGASVYAAPDFVVRDGVASLYVRFGSRRVARLRTDMGAVAVGDENGSGSTDVGDAVLTSGVERLRRLRGSARRLLHDSSDDLTYLHSDLQGSIVAATAEDGSLVAERAFYPIGLERASTGFVDPYGFTGQEHDESTGLYAFRARYYDPMAGRWTAIDPLFGVLDGSNVGALGQSTTAYAYVANNPINSVDPTGLLGKKLVRGIRRGLRRARKGTQNRIGRAVRGSFERIFPNRNAVLSKRDAGRQTAATDARTAARANEATARTALRDAQTRLDGVRADGNRLLEGSTRQNQPTVRQLDQLNSNLRAAQGEVAAARTNHETAVGQLAAANQEVARFDGLADRKSDRSNAQVVTGLAVVLGGITGLAVAAGVGAASEEPGEEGGGLADAF